jgi:hypothetical protein
MIGLLDAIKIGAGGLIGALLMLGFFALIIQPQAHERGRETERAAMAVATQKAEMERKGDDALLRTLSDYDLCVEYLRDRRMPVDACESLRGVQPE